MPATLTQQRIPCQDTPEAFWPEKVWTTEGKAQIATAVALCRTCPARVACLAEALALPASRVAGSVAGGVYHPTRRQRTYPGSPR